MLLSILILIEMKISIIGSGQVGERIGKTFAKKGHNVLFYDVKKEVLERLKNEGYKTTNNPKEVIDKTNISFISVPTPIDENGNYDYSYIKSVAETFGSFLKDVYHVFVLKSTVTPGTTENILIRGLEESSGKKTDKDFGVVYNPEFLTVIEKTWTDDEGFRITPGNEGRIVIGLSEKALKDGNGVFKVIKELYFSFGLDILKTDYKTAEFTKLAANNRLSLAISYSNELFLFSQMLKEKGVNIDIDFVIKAVHMDHRIGPYGSVFGKAWGGPCFKKDTKAFERFFLDTTGESPSLISNNIKINEKMKEFGIRE